MEIGNRIQLARRLVSYLSNENIFQIESIHLGKDSAGKNTLCITVVDLGPLYKKEKGDSQQTNNRPGGE